MTYPLRAPLHFLLREIAQRLSGDLIDRDELTDFAAQLVRAGADDPFVVTLASHGPVDSLHGEATDVFREILSRLGYPPLEFDQWWRTPDALDLWEDVQRDSPSFMALWDPDDDNEFVTAGQLAGHIARLLSVKKDSEEVRRIFVTIEQHLYRCYRRELILSGLFEHLHEDIEREVGLSDADVEPFLGPETRRMMWGSSSAPSG